MPASASSAPFVKRRVLVPGPWEREHPVGPVRGFYHVETGVLNLVDAEGALAERAPVAGSIVPEESAPAWAVRACVAPTASREALWAMIRGAGADVDGSFGQVDVADPAGFADSTGPAAPDDPPFVLFWRGDGLCCAGPGGRYEVEYYDLHRDLFSRNTGILETDLMAEKRAVIFGCGSVGSLVALELARSGVGYFLLIDADVLEYHNLCRHQCGVHDVGRYKVDAVRDRILDINPAATVERLRTRAERVPEDVFRTWCAPGDTLLVGCADNRGADVHANGVAAVFGVPFLSIGFWERAFAGELFYWLPGEGMPCYRCALGTGGDGLSQRVSANHHVYTDQEDLARVNFEPGISADIDFVTTVGVKLALDILNRGNDRFTPRLLPTLAQYTLVCNTNDPRVGGPAAEIFSYPLQVTTSLTVGFGGSCPPCEFESEGGAR